MMRDNAEAPLAYLLGGAWCCGCFPSRRCAHLVCLGCLCSIQLSYRGQQRCRQNTYSDLVPDSVARLRIPCVPAKPRAAWVVGGGVAKVWRFGVRALRVFRATFPRTPHDFLEEDPSPRSLGCRRRRYVVLRLDHQPLQPAAIRQVDTGSCTRRLALADRRVLDCTLVRLVVGSGGRRSARGPRGSVARRETRPDISPLLRGHLRRGEVEMALRRKSGDPLQHFAVLCSLRTPDDPHAGPCGLRPSLGLHAPL